MHSSFIVVSTITAFQQTQTASLTALNFFFSITTLQLRCSCFPAILIFEQEEDLKELLEYQVKETIQEMIYLREEQNVEELPPLFCTDSFNRLPLHVTRRVFLQ